MIADFVCGHCRLEGCRQILARQYSDTLGSVAIFKDDFLISLDKRYTFQSVCKISVSVLKYGLNLTVGANAESSSNRLVTTGVLRPADRYLSIV